MDDNEGYDSFEVNDTDLEYALNPGARRFKQTKDSQIYGVWADEDNYDSRPAFGRRAAKPSGPVRFISGGVAAGSKKKQEEDDDEGPGPSRKDLDEDVIEIPLVPEKKARKTMGKGMAGDKSFAGMRGPKSDGAPGSWASDKVKNMMKNMGWQSGKGLGQQGQGIVEPIEAILRPGRGAVGAYGNETKGLKFGESAGSAQRRGGIDDEEDYDDVEIEEVRTNAWKKSNAGKVRPKYKTLDELVRERDEFDQPNIVQKSNIKFIDMTGPTQKVYDNFHSFQQQADTERQEKRKNFDLPALNDNLDHLILSCKNEIHLNNDHLQDLKNKTSGMERDKEELERYVETATANMDKVESVIDLVKRFNNPTSHGLDALDEYNELFYRIKTEYFSEFVTFGLDCLVEFKVLPLMKQLFMRWDPLNPETIDHGFEQMQSWRTLLNEDTNTVFKNRHESDKANVYDLLVWNAWMPIVQRAATRWDPRTDFSQMVELVATWIPILPSWIHDNLFDNVIVQKIRERVEEWDPINDEIPIDSWIVPWHQILGDRLLIVYPQIRQKLAKALRQWQATDSTAVAVLKPWKDVFTHSVMQTFLNTHIVPKLEESLQRMNLNPTQNTEYAEFYATLEWKDLLSMELICDVLVRNFFTRWYENLCRWLRLPGSIDDVSRYYREWKERIPAELFQMKPIQAEFVRALMAIKQVREGVPIMQMPSFEQSQSINVPLVQPPLPINVQPSFAPTSFKQLLEYRARELNLVFAPQPNRYYHGHMVYWFGGSSIYIDGTALFAYDTINRAWMPISLEHLISTS